MRYAACYIHAQPVVQPGLCLLCVFVPPGGRSARLVNPLAWERGAVFAQCQPCGVWHTLAAQPHIIEEIRYNDPEWQQPGAAAATAGEDVAAASAVFVSQPGAQLGHTHHTHQVIHSQPVHLSSTSACCILSLYNVSAGVMCTADADSTPFFAVTTVRCATSVKDTTCILFWLHYLAAGVSHQRAYAFVRA